jgi:hypothetical protein
MIPPWNAVTYTPDAPSGSFGGAHRRRLQYRRECRRRRAPQKDRRGADRDRRGFYMCAAGKRGQGRECGRHRGEAADDRCLGVSIRRSGHHRDPEQARDAEAGEQPRQVRPADTDDIPENHHDERVGDEVAGDSEERQHTQRD